MVITVKIKPLVNKKNRILPTNDSIIPKSKRPGIEPGLFVSLDRLASITDNMNSESSLY